MRELDVVPPDLILALGAAFGANSVWLVLGCASSRSDVATRSHPSAAKFAASHLAPFRGLLGSGLRLGLQHVFLFSSPNNPVCCPFFEFVTVLVAQFLLVCRPALVVVTCRSDGVHLGAGLPEDVIPASCRGFVKGMMLMCRWLSFFEGNMRHELIVTENG